MGEKVGSVGQLAADYKVKHRIERVRDLFTDNMWWYIEEFPVYSDLPTQTRSGALRSWYYSGNVDSIPQELAVPLSMWLHPKVLALDGVTRRERRNIFLHEFAHLVAVMKWNDDTHDLNWEYVMRKLGAPIEVKHRIASLLR